ncbi:hypothetical protein SE957_11530 [Escherichia coli]|nr:hypothetical protein [Escherichia coli]
MKKQRLTALCLACLQSGKPDQEKLAGHNSIYPLPTVFTPIIFPHLFALIHIKIYFPTKTIAFYLQMNRMRRILGFKQQKGEFRVAR